MMMRMHRRGGDVLLAACDEELVGRDLREGRMRLQVSEGFYSGQRANEEMLVNRLSNATMANLVGERVVGIAVDNDFVDPGSVISIEGVPHAQMVRM